MNAVQTFVHEARAKGLTDEQITQLMVEQGWPHGQAQAAVMGLHVPPPPHASGAAIAPEAPTSQQPSAPARKSITALEAALQHILLWLFTITSSVMLSIVSASLFGEGSSSSDVLLTYLVVEIVTFLPFLLLFIHYMRQFRRQQDITTGRIWSIITIVFHSIGLVGALVALLLFVVLVDGSDRGAGVAASFAIAVMNAVVVAAYATANFVKPTYRWRWLVLITFPMVLFVLIGIFGLIALHRVGPIKEDAQTRKDLVTTVEQLQAYTKTQKRLPDSLVQLDHPKSGIVYTKKTATQYELCAVFNRDTSDEESYNDEPFDDDYISEYYFEGFKPGQQCFDVQATALMRYNDYTGEYEPITT